MDDSALEPVIPPLAERMPQYLTMFGAGFVVASLAGAVFGILFGDSVAAGAGYALMFLGVSLLLVGGATGGGYTNIGLGAVGTLLGGRHRHDTDYSDPEVRSGNLEKNDPMERLRKGLRPGKNPTAFWQVVGGIAYVVLGILIVESLS